MRSRGSRNRPRGELLRVVLDLVEQHRHEINHAADLRMAFEVRRHVDVVLHGVQVHPGQDELAGRRACPRSGISGTQSEPAPTIAPWSR
jgi:hypothetical protein